MSKKLDYDFEFKKLSKTQQDCLNLIESLGIYELRALARVFGDNSPTTLKRDDHINIIMKKIISGDELRPIPLRQGRPYKELSNIEGILSELSEITGKNYNLKNPTQQRTTSQFQKVVTFKQMEEDIVSQKLFPIEVKGILCNRNEKEFYFINQCNNKIILVKKNMDNRLREFDFVSGTAVIMNNEKEYILDSIKTINYQSEQEYELKENPYNKTIPTEELMVNDSKILLGSRYLIKKSKFIKSIDRIKRAVEILKENKIITISLIPNVMYEDFLSISSLGFNNNIILKYDEKPLTIYDMITTTIEHINHLQSLGYNVAFFAEDLNTLANSVDFAFKESVSPLGHTEISVDIIKQLIMLAKSGGQGKHTTFFTTYSDVDMFDKLYVSSVYKVCKEIEF